MNPVAIPDTTYKLLEAIRKLHGTSASVNVKKVIISDDGRNGGIDYFPVKSRFTSAAIEQAGISDLVQLYLFQCTRHTVKKHFRPGVYDVSGAEIKIIK
jgi:hypothetical protein